MRRPGRRLRSVLLLALTAGLLPACESALLTKGEVAQLSAADANELQGCFLCLKDAHDTYARLAVGRRRPIVITRLFETDLLLALREKELAMDPSAPLAEALALAPELGPTVDVRRYIADVDAVFADDVGTPEADQVQMTFAELTQGQDARGEVAWLVAAGPLRAPVGQYLALSLGCDRPGRVGGALKGIDVTAAASPLIRYRSAMCGLPNDVVLRAIHAEVPRFFEISFFLAKRAVALLARQGPRDARALLTEAYAHFPTSPSVTYLDGNFDQLMGDCHAALARFGETLALRPTHENALLGQVQCLSYLKEFDQAIGVATYMLSANIKPIEALYWRAWDYWQSQRLASARTDIESAKARGFRPDVYQLAGIIEHDQNDLDPAEKDLLSVVHSPGGREACSAHWYLGLVYMKKARWVDSASAFVGAYSCYEGSVADDLNQIARLQKRADLDPGYQASQLAKLQSTLTEDRSQEYAAAYNAANHYARGGDIPKARPFLEIAAQDPALADLVKTLRDVIK